MWRRKGVKLQFIVFALVSASFTNIYVTQPVLPILQSEFSADLVLVSFSVSAVIFGIALSNLPFGILALIKRWDLSRIYLCATGSFAIFSLVFNYLAKRLS